MSLFFNSLILLCISSSSTYIYPNHSLAVCTYFYSLCCHCGKKCENYYYVLMIMKNVIGQLKGFLAIDNIFFQYRSILRLG